MGKHSVVGDERGLTTVEYVIILVLLAVMAIVTWRTFGSAIKGQVGTSTEAINKLGEESSTETTSTTPPQTK